MTLSGLDFVESMEGLSCMTEVMGVYTISQKKKEGFMCLVSASQVSASSIYSTPINADVIH